MTFDTNKIKGISIYDWMIKNGYKQGRGSSGKWRSFYSPFGAEANDSFKINTANNTWKDYHDNSRGDVINLIMKLENVEFQEACAILTNDTHVEVKVHSIKKAAEGVKIHSVDEITDKELIEYFTEKRKIDINVLKRWCKQVSFSFPLSGKDPNKVYTSLGFRSDLKGFELRSSWMKLCAGAKSYTTIRGTNKDAVILTEGFCDYLAYMTYYKLTEPKYTVYVLNGATQFDSLKAFIGDKRVLYYGDSDAAGDSIAEQIPNLDDKRYVYGFFNDFNDFLMFG